MTNNEQLMYQILGKFSDIDAPIVFKGALITKLVLAEGGFTSFERPTINLRASRVNLTLTRFIRTWRNFCIRSYSGMKHRCFGTAVRCRGTLLLLTRTYR